MGTYYSVKYVDDFPSLSKEQVQVEVEKILADVNKQMSTYIPDSEISRFNKVSKNTEFKISKDFSEVLKYSLELAQKTSGSFDPSVGPLVNLWGFGPSKVRKKPSDEKIKETLNLVGYKNIKFSKSDSKLSKSISKLYLDLSATAKGYAVDKISKFMISRQYNNHLVDIGGELYASGKKPDTNWSVAIETPDESNSSIQKILSLSNEAIATSGSYRNFFTENGIRYNHTIDTKTGLSYRSDLVSVSVLSKNAMQADGLATALMTMGFNKAKNFATKNNIKVYLIKYSGEKTEVFSNINSKK